MKWISLAIMMAMTLAMLGCATGNNTRAHWVTPLTLIGYRSSFVYIVPVEGTAVSNGVTNGVMMEGGGTATLPLSNSGK